MYLLLIELAISQCLFLSTTLGIVPDVLVKDIVAVLQPSVLYIRRCWMNNPAGHPAGLFVRISICTSPLVCN